MSSIAQKTKNRKLLYKEEVLFRFRTEPLYCYMTVKRREWYNANKKILRIPKIFEYFKRELEKESYNVILPEFPVREEITVEGYFEVFDKYKELFNEDLIVVAHSIGNPMFIKYIAKYNLKVGKYISLAGFSKDFFNEGKDVLNE